MAGRGAARDESNRAEFGPPPIELAIPRSGCAEGGYLMAWKGAGLISDHECLVTLP